MKVRNLTPTQLASLAAHCIGKLEQHDARMNKNANSQAYQKMARYLKAAEAVYATEQVKTEEQDPFESLFGEASQHFAPAAKQAQGAFRPR